MHLHPQQPTGPQTWRLTLIQTPSLHSAPGKLLWAEALRGATYQPMSQDSRDMHLARKCSRQWTTVRPNSPPNTVQFSRAFFPNRYQYRQKAHENWQENAQCTRFGWHGPIGPFPGLAQGPEWSEPDPVRKPSMSQAHMWPTHPTTQAPGVPVPALADQACHAPRP